MTRKKIDFTGSFVTVQQCDRKFLKTNEIINMRTAYKRNDGHDLLNELERERSARIRMEGQLAEMSEIVYAKIRGSIYE